MSDTANEPTTMIERLNTGGGSMSWADRAKGVQEWLKFAEQVLQDIMDMDDVITPSYTSKRCGSVMGYLGAIAVTVDLLASVCEEKGRQQVPDEDRERRETRRNLAAIDDLAMQLRRVRDEGDDTSDKCISAGIMTHVYELRSLLAIRE